MRQLILGAVVLAAAGCTGSDGPAASDGARGGGTGGSGAAGAAGASPSAGAAGSAAGVGASAGAAAGGQSGGGASGEGGKAGGDAAGSAGGGASGAGGNGAAGATLNANCADIRLTNAALGRTPGEWSLGVASNGKGLSFQPDGVRWFGGAPTTKPLEYEPILASFNSSGGAATWVSPGLDVALGGIVWSPDGEVALTSGGGVVSWSGAKVIAKGGIPYDKTKWLPHHVVWDGEAFWTMLVGAESDAAFYRTDLTGAVIQPVTPLANKVYGSPASKGAYRMQGAAGSGLVWLGGRGPSARAWNRQGAEVFPESVGFDDVNNPSIGVDDQGMWMMTRHAFQPGPDKPDSYRPQVYRFDNAGELTSYPRPALPDWDGTDDAFAIRGDAHTARLVVAASTGIFLFEWDGVAMGPPRAVLATSIKLLGPGKTPTPDPYFGYYVRWRDMELFEVGTQRWILGEDITGPGQGVWRALRVDDPSCVYESKRPYPG